MKIKNLLLLLLMYLVVYGCKEEIESYEKPVVKTLEVSKITDHEAYCGGQITYAGNVDVTDSGIVWSTKENPTVEKNQGIKNNVDKVWKFFADISNLTDHTTYYVRAYAANSEGISYGEEKSFTTIDLTVPVLTTSNVSKVTYSAAQCGGNITNNGNVVISARGIVWDTIQNPTIKKNIGKSSDSVGVGEFTSRVIGLNDNSTYFVRAYATNSEGTSYGEEVNFKTKLFNSSERTEELIESTSLVMIPVLGGAFKMGSTVLNYHSETIHSVILKSFEIGKYEVTQAQWKAVMGGANPSNWIGDSLPVERVSWNDVQTFITKLNEQTGKTYRLLTEAEWEFAARGGNSSNGYTYIGGDSIKEVAWYSNNSSSKTHAVGNKKSNELGIYDMAGNVSEWCNDWYNDYYYSNSPSENPPGPSTGSKRVLRGGGYSTFGSYCISTDRRSDIPTKQLRSIGFRLARSL